MSKKKDGSRFDDLFSAASSGRSGQEQSEPIDLAPVRKPKSTDPDYVRTTVYLPKQLHKKLKAAAADEEREMSDIAAEAITLYLEQRREKRG